MATPSVQALSYDEIAVGRKAAIRVELTADKIDAFARLTGDINPLHADAEFAKSKGFPRRVSHGLLVGSFFSTIAGTLLPGRDCLLHSAKFDFKKPVLEGTTLDLEAVVVQKSDAARVLVLDISARGADGAVALSGRIQAAVLP